MACAQDHTKGTEHPDRDMIACITVLFIPAQVIDSYNPVRKCRLEEDVSACNRGECCALHSRSAGGVVLSLSSTSARLDRKGSLLQNDPQPGCS